MTKHRSNNSSKSNINIIIISMGIVRRIMAQQGTTLRPGLTMARMARMVQPVDRLKATVRKLETALKPLATEPPATVPLAMVLRQVMSLQGTTRSARRRSVSTKQKLWKRIRPQR